MTAQGIFDGPRWSLVRPERAAGIQGEVHPTRFTIIEKGQESGYVAYAPVPKGCVSQGRTKDGARRNGNEAMEAYMEVLDGRTLEDLMRQRAPVARLLGIPLVAASASP